MLMISWDLSLCSHSTPNDIFLKVKLQKRTVHHTGICTRAPTPLQPNGIPWCGSYNGGIVIGRQWSSLIEARFIMATLALGRKGGISLLRGIPEIIRRQYPEGLRKEGKPMSVDLRRVKSHCPLLLQKEVRSHCPIISESGGSYCPEKLRKGMPLAGGLRSWAETTAQRD